MNEKKDYYSLLNISRDATPSEISVSYDRLKKEMTFWGVSSTEYFSSLAKVQEAHEVLTDELSRARYDASIMREELQKEIEIKETQNNTLSSMLESQESKASDMKNEINELLSNINSLKGKLENKQKEYEDLVEEKESLDENLALAYHYSEYYERQNTRLLSLLRAYKTDRYKIILIAIMTTIVSVSILIINVI